MSNDLIQAIREKRQLILDLRRQANELEAELAAATTVLAEPLKAKRRGPMNRKRPIRPQSTVWWAQKVLNHHRQPMAIDDLVRRVEEFSGKAVRKSTLVSNLSRYVKADDTFCRPEEGFYALKEFEDA